MTIATGTGTGAGAANECPTLEALSAPTTAVEAHVRDCAACRIVAELVARRNDAGDARADCERYEDLMAARDDGPIGTTAAGMIDAHLATCAACSAVANTMAPRADAHGDHSTLPAVATSAYALGREVARGGMGRIFAARDLRIGRDVAVKELLGGGGGAFAARFEREARVTARLQHPGIVPIYEIGTWPDGTPFYTMRMVEGTTLGAAIAAKPALADRLALLPSLIAAAEAIAFAHAHLVIHRDLTPANILVGEFGETVVIDWGLAKDLAGEVADDATLEVGPYRAEPAAEGLTAVGAVIGTAAYMPPEQARGEPVDERGDVYALGALLYQLLVGAAPYRAATSIEVVESVKDGPPLAIDALVPAAPRDLVSIAHKAMSRDPAARYASARELAEELVRFQAGRIVEAHSYSRGELVRRWVRSHRAAVIGAAAALVALVVAGSIGLTGVLRERDRADNEASEAIAARSVAEAQKIKSNAIAVSLLEEQGRQELLAGHGARALTYLDAAMQQGLDTPALRFMLASALRSLEGDARKITCGGPVRGFDVSRDMTHIAAACADTVRLWGSDAQPQFSIPVKKAANVLFSHDGRLVLALGDSAVLADVASGVVIRAFEGRAEFGSFTADDLRVVVVQHNGIVQIWSTSTGARLREFHVPTRVADNVSVASSGDGHVLAISTLSGHVEIWDVDAVKQIRTYEHGAQVNAIATSDDGGVVATCGTDRTAKIRTAAGIRTIDAHREMVMACAVSSDGTRLALASPDGAVDEWDPATGHMIARFAPAPFVSGIAFSPDGRLIATRGLTDVRIWAADTGALVAQHALGDFGWRRAMFSRDGARLFVGDGTQLVAWSAIVPWRSSFVAPREEIVIDVNKDGTRALTQRDDGTLSLWDTRTSTRIHHEPIHSAPWVTILDDSPAEAFSDDGIRFAAPNDDGLVVLDVASGATIARIPVRGIEQFWLDGAGHRVITRGGGPPRVWDVDRGSLVMSFDADSHVALLDARGRRLLVWTDPKIAQVFDLDEKRVVATLHLDGPFTPLGFGAEGTSVLVQEQPGSFNAGLYELFDVQTGQRTAARAGNSAEFDSSRRLVAVFGSGRVDVWRASDGTRLSAAQIRPPGLDDANPLPAVSDDGAFVVATDETVSSLAIMSASDGRVLGKLDTVLGPSKLLPDGHLAWYGAASHWLPHSHSIVANTGHTAIWDLTLETRSAQQIHRITSLAVPWQVIDGKLVAKLGRIEGRVTRAGTPAANVRIFAKRQPQNVAYDTTSDAAGSFSLEDVPASAYEVSAGGPGVTTNVTGFETVPVELTTP